MGHNYQTRGPELYQTVLDKYLIEQTSDYYKRKSRSWLDQDSCPSYLHKAEQCMSQEQNRVDSYLNQVTMAPLLEAVFVQVLKEHQKELLNKSTGMNHMLELHQTEGTIACQCCIPFCVGILSCYWILACVVLA